MQDTLAFEPSQHVGQKISSVRRLVGLSQTALGQKLGLTKQAISKLEQSEKVDHRRLKSIANALGVTEEGLKNFNNDRIIYNTINFYENCGVKAESVNATVENLHQFPMEKLNTLFEELLKIDREKFENVTAAKKKHT